MFMPKKHAKILVAFSKLCYLCIVKLIFKNYEK